MFFEIKNTNKYIVVLTAKSIINRYKMTASEIALNNYCIKNYKLSLKQLCLNLVLAARYNYYLDNIIVTFNTKKEDNLASLITYGNEKFKGSNILKAAFGRN